MTVIKFVLIISLGMDQTVELEKAKRVRVSWKNLSVVRTFLDACIQEISLNGREGGSLKAHSWKKSRTST